MSPLKSGTNYCKLSSVRQSEYRFRFLQIDTSELWGQIKPWFQQGMTLTGSYPNYILPPSKCGVNSHWLGRSHSPVWSRMQNNWPHNYSEHASSVNIIFSVFVKQLLSFFSRLWSFLFHLRSCSGRATRVKTGERETGEKTQRGKGTMESILSEQSATVDELLEACIQAFGWSFKQDLFLHR